jgi:integrase
MPDRPGVSYGKKPRADGRWQGYIVLARGRRRTVIRPTEVEMRAEVDRIAAQRDQGREPATGDPRLDAFLDWWIVQRRDGVIGRRPLAPSTVLRYEQLVRLQIAPAIGSIRLSRLRPIHVDELLAELKRRRCSGTVRLQVFRLLHVAMVYAERRGMVTRNPCDLVDPPPRDAVQPRELDVEAVAAVVLAARNHLCEAMLWTALGTGVRQGELFALRITDLDLDAARVTIREKVQWLPGLGSHRSPPKTAAGVRTLALSAFVVAALRKHLAELEQSGRPNPLGLVFPSAAGTHFQASNWNKNVWAVWKEQAKIDPATPFRALTRKAHASLLVSLGVDRETLRHRAGHTSATTTETYYVQTVTAADQDAARRLDRALRALAAPSPKPHRRGRSAGEK